MVFPTSGSFRVFSMIQNESSAVEWLGWFRTTEVVPFGCSSKSTSSVPIYSVPHTSSYDILVRIIEDLSFCGWMLWDLNGSILPTTHTPFLWVSYVLEHRPITWILWVYQPWVFRGCEVAFFESFRFAGREACKAPAEQTANKKSGAQLSICCLTSGLFQRHQRHLSKVLRVELMAYWTPPSKSLRQVVLGSYKTSHLINERSGKPKTKQSSPQVYHP